MRILNQRDPRWADIILGTGSTTIGQDGCFITCIAMLLNTTPDIVNNQMIDKGGYANGNEVNWDALPNVFPGIQVRRVWEYNNDDVKANVPCLVQVDASPIGGTIHAVVYIGNEQLYDPWDGTQKSTDTYTPQNYAVITGTWQQVDLQTQLDACNKDKDGIYNQLQDALHTISEKNDIITNLTSDYQRLKTTCDNQQAQINDRNNNITTLNAKIETLQTQLTASQDQVTTLTPIAQQVPNLKEQLAQAEHDRSLCLNAQGSQNQLISNLRQQIAAGKPKTLKDKLIFLFS